jgi:hypothetical protein
MLKRKDNENKEVMPKREEMEIKTNIRIKHLGTLLILCPLKSLNSKSWKSKRAVIYISLPEVFPN